MTTRREVLLALARGRDGDEVTVEIADGVAFIRCAGDTLPLVGVPVVERTFDSAGLLREVADVADERPVPCGGREPHDAHRYLIASSSTVQAYGRCPGVPVPERSP